MSLDWAWCGSPAGVCFLARFTSSLRYFDGLMNYRASLDRDRCASNGKPTGFCWGESREKQYMYSY